MGLWKITDKGPQKVTETRLKRERLLEEHLEDWIAKALRFLKARRVCVDRNHQPSPRKRQSWAYHLRAE